MVSVTGRRPVHIACCGYLDTVGREEWWAVLLAVLVQIEQLQSREVDVEWQQETVVLMCHHFPVRSNRSDPWTFFLSIYHSRIAEPRRVSKEANAAFSAPCQ